MKILIEMWSVDSDLRETWLVILLETLTDTWSGHSMGTLKAATLEFDCVELGLFNGNMLELFDSDTLGLFDGDFDQDFHGLTVKDFDSDTLLSFKDDMLGHKFD